MENSVVIKGNKHGIVVVLNENVPYDDLKEQVRDKFIASSKFFGNAAMALGFEGRSMTFDQQVEIADIITDVSQLNIVCLIDDDKEREEKFAAALKNAFNSQDSAAKNIEYAQCNDIKQNNTDSAQNGDNKATGLNEGQFYKGTLRSGQVFEAESSIVILGDVNPGGRVIAKGNIIVLGSLKGNAFAGADGNEDAFVVALDMDPMQVKIGDVIARSSNNAPRKRLKAVKGIQPKIAFVENGNIYIENLDQSVIEDIRLN